MRRMLWRTRRMMLKETTQPQSQKPWTYPKRKPNSKFNQQDILERMFPPSSVESLMLEKLAVYKGTSLGFKILKESKWIFSENYSDFPPTSFSLLFEYPVVSIVVFSSSLIFVMISSHWCTGNLGYCVQNSIEHQQCTIVYSDKWEEARDGEYWGWFMWVL